MYVTRVLSLDDCIGNDCIEQQRRNRRENDK